MTLGTTTSFSAARLLYNISVHQPVFQSVEPRHVFMTNIANIIDTVGLMTGLAV